jgi:hypothetical protein
LPPPPNSYPRTKSPSIEITPPVTVFGQLGRKEFDDLGAVLDRLESPKGHQLGSSAIALAAARNDRLHDPAGGDRAGGNAVHRDTGRPEILSQIRV